MRVVNGGSRTFIDEEDGFKKLSDRGDAKHARAFVFHRLITSEEAGHQASRLLMTAFSAPQIHGLRQQM